tara:strand:- start:1003 stop:1152 length:150 start_codon:yes stop_codon:yes gene_type:complete
MFIFFLIGIICGIYMKETMHIPKIKPLMKKLFDGNRTDVVEPEEDDKKE